MDWRWIIVGALALGCVAGPRHEDGNSGAEGPEAGTDESGPDGSAPPGGTETGSGPEDPDGWETDTLSAGGDDEGPPPQCDADEDCDVDDDSGCVVPFCIDGACVAAEVADGTPCTTGWCNAGYCDYPECADEHPCDIVELTDQGVCSYSHADDGEAPDQWQTEGDCEVVMCSDGLVDWVPDPGDLPDDENDCTLDQCGPDGPEHLPVEDGTPCGIDGRCDGAGTCIA